MNAQSQIRMIASWNRGVFIPLVGAMAQASTVYNFLKDRGARISLDHVKGMIEGKEHGFKDFEVVQVVGARLIAGESIPAASTVASDSAQQQAAPAPAQPSQTKMVPTGPQPATMPSGSAQVARGRGRSYAPSGNIKPLKRGTTYAKLMEALLKNDGATMKELLAMVNNQTSGGVNDVLSWQIKQRGYGLNYNAGTGKYKLVLPEGHKELVYQD